MELSSLFNKGMVRDTDYDNQPEGTYRESINGRILYEPNGALSWVNVSGTLISFTIKTGYNVKGIAEFPDKLIAISSNGDFSEIGRAVYDSKKRITTY